MIRTKKLVLIISILALSGLLSGCISSTKKPVINDGGVYKSLNKGLAWAQKTLIPSIAGGARTFAGVNMASMVMDPSDNKAIYFGSVDNGMFYTYDGGETWQIANSLGKITVRSIAVDPAYKCTIYASSGNKLFKSMDCSRSWTQAYYDNELMATVDAVAIDQTNPANVYIGVSRGDIIKSSNRGEEWQTIYRLNNKIKKLIIDPNDSNRMYVLTANKGLWYTTDGGKNFSELTTTKDAFRLLNISTEIKDVVLVNNNPGLIFLATANGMMRSSDSGAKWEKIELIPDANKAAVNTLAVNDKDTNEIYYVTNTTFYRSADGGKTWKTLKLPTARGGWKITIDPLDANIIYLGVSNAMK